MRPFGVPQVFLLVPAQDAAVAGDEVGDVVQLGAMALDDGARHDADGELLGEALVGGEIALRIRARLEEAWLRRQPVGQMVFGEHG